MATHENNLKRESKSVGIPFKSFLYTLEQVADMIQVDLVSFQKKYVHYDSRTPGIKRADKFFARNVSPMGEKPEWRITDTEVLRWFKSKGYKVIERGWALF